MRKTGATDMLTAALTWQNITTNQGHRLEDLSRNGPVLLIFLRHSGCPFCRETLSRLKTQRQQLEAQHVQIVLIHMLPDAAAVKFFRGYGMDDLQRISDPDRTVYQLFDVPQGSWWQVAGPGVWWRGLKSTLTGSGPGIPQGDLRQLSGTLLLRDGEIVSVHHPENSADIPEFTEFAQCDLTPPEPAPATDGTAGAE